jgi:hypothetical protein
MDEYLLVLCMVSTRTFNVYRKLLVFVLIQNITVVYKKAVLLMRCTSTGSLTGTHHAQVHVLFSYLFYKAQVFLEFR